MDTLKLTHTLIKHLFQKTWRWDLILKEWLRVSTGALPLVCIASSFAGFVISTEIAWHMNLALHTVTMIPGFTAQFIIRELAVIIATMLIISKSGAALTAELGLMKVSDQLAAFRIFRIDPVSIIVFPNWIAFTLSVLSLSMFSIFVAVLSALFVATIQYQFNTLEYVVGLQHFVKISDLFSAAVKSVVFGAVIPIVSSAYGLSCSGGAKGVGSATTRAMVTSTLLVIFFDFLLTYLMS
jgi:phospholipid/cholesterol/gamma-HCH transport system permease protein